MEQTFLFPIKATGTPLFIEMKMRLFLYVENFKLFFEKKKLTQSHLCLYVEMYIHENENTIFAIYAHSITRIYNQFIYVKWVCH